MHSALLVVQNAKWEGPGLVELHARAAGVSVVKLELFRGSRRANVVPVRDLEDRRFSAVVALGSPSTAYLPQTNPHHRDLVNLFRLVRRAKIPSFNICYSMQLFCIAHGGRVVRNPAGKEIGLEEVLPTAEGMSDPVIGSIAPYRTLQWHGDVVAELPPGAVLLASSRKTKNQVAVLDGIHYLVQGDGQAATPGMIRSWLRHDLRWATQGTGLRASDILREAEANEPYLRNTFLRIFGAFLALALKPQA